VYLLRNTPRSARIPLPAVSNSENAPGNHAPLATTLTIRNRREASLSRTHPPIWPGEIVTGDLVPGGPEPDLRGAGVSAS
jgi:hypothetical protein